MNRKNETKFCFSVYIVFICIWYMFILSSEKTFHHLCFIGYHYKYQERKTVGHFLQWPTATLHAYTACHSVQVWILILPSVPAICECGPWKASKDGVWSWVPATIARGRWDFCPSLWSHFWTVNQETDTSSQSLPLSFSLLFSFTKKSRYVTKTNQRRNLCVIM